MMTRLTTAVAAVLLAAGNGYPVLGQALPTILTIDVANLVEYQADIYDPSKWGSNPNITPSAGAREFGVVTLLADIVAVNGKPAKGLWQNVLSIMPFKANPSPGQPIADLDSGGIAQCEWEILGPDGSYIGALLDGGAGVGGHALKGGLGVFAGVTGIHTGETSVPSRNASSSEDPARRRVNGGGKMRGTFYIYPASRPAVQMTSSGPAIVHQDYSQVTTTNPAHPGELLIVAATGLGPVKPGILPAGVAPFSGPPYQEVSAPVTVLFNGNEVPVTTKVGWPGQKNVYWVDFPVPSDAATGTATLQLTAAWIPGPAVSVPVAAR